ncbi:TonB-dependent receptor [Halioxenophilus sp. WMMB6]|uniref:TonB-dependent receptor n=1 Tax=Halioxenophilus sp. WMMB6 TaxID=3073815 RepID=UPI00295E3913|nr:TonB-dependent receptor [Halioxenophilus sp. WMMB6]
MPSSKITIPRYTKTILAAVIGVQTIPSVSANDSSRFTIEEVVVTAQRREESIQDVPLAISALSSETLKNAGITNSTQLSTVVPNLSVNSSFGNTQPNFSLRGVSVANEYNANQVSPIGVYIDEAYMASRSLHGMQLYDLDRVEVLRGPQGTLYGRNTTGGAINFITKYPTLSNDSEAYIDVGYGNFDHKRAQGAFEKTLIADTLGIRAAVNYDKTDGYIENKHPGGKDGNSNDSVSGRLSVRYQPTDDLDIKFKIYGGEDKPTQAAVHGIGTANGINPLIGYSREGLDFYTVEQDKIGISETNSNGLLLRVDYQLSNSWSITSLTSSDSGEQVIDQDSDGSPFDLLFINWHSEFSQFNQELHLDYTGENLSGIVGVYYGWDTTETRNEFYFFHFLEDLGVPADPIGLTTGGFRIVQEYEQRRDSKAIFAQGDYNLSDHFKLTAGIRYTQDDAEYSDGRSYTTDYDGNPAITLIPVPGPYTTEVLPTQEEDDSAITGRLALSYTFDTGRMVYASFSHGYRSGTFNGGGYIDASQIQYVEPEKVDAYEIGAKGYFLNDDLSLAGAIFQYDYSDQQVQEVVGPVAFLRNAGESTIRGLDLEFTAVVTENLKINGSMGLLDAKYEKLELSGNDLSGNDLPFSSDMTAQLGLDWRIASLADGDLILTPNINYASEQWFSPYNDKNGNSNLRQGGYSKINTTVSWQNDRVTISAWCNNVTDKEYYGYGLDLRDTFGYDFMIPGSPRTFGLSVRYDYF